MRSRKKGQSERVQVFLPLTMHLRGGRKTITSPLPLAQVVRPKPTFDNAMIKALARAFRWRRRIEKGEFSSITDLAKAERVNQSYACRLLRLTLLAPEIVQAIADGNQSADLTLHHLLQPFPSDWEAQRKVFRSSKRGNNGW